MISLPDSWYTSGWFKDWLQDAGWFGTSEESRRHGARPRFFFTILPHYFLTGVAAGSGTFADTEFVAPDRIQVSAGAGAASWTSPVLQANVGSTPVTVNVSWTLNYPGYDTPAVEYRTAASQAALLAASWETLTDPVELDLYYQWRVSWAPIRSWAFDTEPEMDETAAWALDAYDPEDEYQSYAGDSGDGVVAYIEGVSFTGEFLLDPNDILDPGVLELNAPGDFSDLVAGDHTLVLINRDNRYSPRHPNFIFVDETHWYKKSLRIQMAYLLPSGELTEKVTLYEGMITRWGTLPHRADQDGRMEEHSIAIESRDYIAQLLDQKIGTPDDDGKPCPLVYGQVLRQADQLGDETLGDPDAEAGFETGDTSELAAVDTGSGGAAAVNADQPYEGDYCLRTSVPATVGAYAQGKLALATTSAEVLFAAFLNFVTVPDDSKPFTEFMGIYNHLGTAVVQLYCQENYKVYVAAGGSYKETSWSLDQSLDMFVRVAIGVVAKSPGVIKVWVNGDEVCNWTGDWSSLVLAGGYIGPRNQAAAQIWDLDSDNWQIFPNFWPQLYQVTGAPFASIDAVYVDGAIKVKGEPAWSATDRRGLKYVPEGVRVRFVGGSAPDSATINRYPVYGAVAFTDLDNPVSGTVMFRLTANAITHPVDIIEDLLTQAGKAVMIDAASFTAARTALPDDWLGCYFEDMSIADAIIAVASRCLINVYMTQGMVKLGAYLGVAATAADLELDESELVGVDESVDMDEIKTQVNVKWGWYERNRQLYYAARDDQAVALLGLYETEIDLSWGGPVGTDSALMAKNKADLLLVRSKAGRSRLEDVSGSLRLARLEIGDHVQVNVPYLGPAAIYEVFGARLRMAPPYGVDLTAIKFMGE